MAGGSSRVIARVFSTHNSEYASLTWEWVIWEEGQVQYRLTQLGGRAERNPWMSSGNQLTGPDLLHASRDPAAAEAWLASFALRRGHSVKGYTA